MPANTTAPGANRPGGTVWRGLAWGALAGFAVLQVWGLYLMVPGEGEPTFPPGTDKVVHAALFAVPVFLALWLRRPWVVLLLVAHALVAEPLQGLLTTTRSPEVLDLVANLVGVLLGVVAARALPQPVRWVQESRAETDMLAR